MVSRCIASDAIIIIIYIIIAVIISYHLYDAIIIISSSCISCIITTLSLAVVTNCNMALAEMRGSSGGNACLERKIYIYIYIYIDR